MTRTDAVKKAQRKYFKKVMRRFSVDLNANTDTDIIERLEQQGVAPYIKRLIREDIAKERKEVAE